MRMLVPMLLLCLGVFGSQAKPTIGDSALTPVTEPDLLEQDQELANRGRLSRGHPTQFRGLGEKEFRRMEKKIKKIKERMAQKLGKNVGDVSGSSLIGDIALTEDQANDMLVHMDGGRVKRKVLNGRRWQLQVPYVIDYSAFSSSYLSNIRAAIDFWGDNTCLEFLEGAPSDESKYIYIQAASSGCWSYVGKQYGSGAQDLNLGGSCAGNIAVIIHELGHALGFYHEQSRPDRDDFLSVIFSNIISGYEGNFDIALNSLTLGVTYDYGSVMHYGSNAFSPDGSPNLVPKDPEYQSVIGQRVTGSFFDIVGMNYAYNCNSCPNLACQNGGIGDSKSNCARCICPEGYGGDLCETSGTMSDGCIPSTGEITVSSTTAQCVNTPNWPSSYGSSGHQCNWILKASQPSQQIEYYFNENSFWMTYGNDGRCYHWAEIKDNTNTTLRGKRYCGPSAPTFTKTSVADTVVVSFSGVYPSSGQGFQLCYRLSSTQGSTSTETPATTTTPESTTTTPASTTTTPASTTTTPTTTTTTTPASTTTTPASTTTTPASTTTTPASTTATPASTTTTPTTTTTTPASTTTTPASTTTSQPSTTTTPASTTTSQPSTTTTPASTTTTPASTTTTPVAITTTTQSSTTTPTSKPCDSSPCQNAGSCSNVGTTGFVCACPPLYTGDDCSIRNACMKWNGEPTCKEDNSERCELDDSRDGFTCHCKLGFTGTRCTTNVCRFKCLSPYSERCEVNQNTGSWKCVCKEGWGGRTCWKNIIDECASQPCQNGGSCRDQWNKFKCICPSEWKGKLCQTPRK